ncbi:hypothetical protein MKQ70_08535 [Chitinophaga sedimenti]|uniref:hypothetical protein n=1 Tax=Chitinophaga sedimenti TaxID=2033606 RepID=UPI002005FAED|nr:hypothetical protein [Chitinophaga sedimenti]MCK7555053.1 hypothetical protein [Chitinophaga sedimenti]
MQYLKLLRPAHWAKNAFLFIPLFFAGELTNVDKIIELIKAFVAFSLIASSIYIINDYRDIENDRKHPKKASAPWQAGR